MARSAGGGSRVCYTRLSSCAGRDAHGRAHVRVWRQFDVGAGIFMKVMETWQTDPQDDSTPAHERDHEIAHLRVLTGRSSQSVYEIRAKGVSIGRLGSDSDVVIDDGRMSRRHARIERSTAGWGLPDP